MILFVLIIGCALIALFNVYLALGLFVCFFGMTAWLAWQFMNQSRNLEQAVEFLTKRIREEN